MRERLPSQTLQKFLIVFSCLALAVSPAFSALPARAAHRAAPKQEPPNRAPNSDATSAFHPPAALAKVCPACVRANMNFLASDALRGRGSGTQDELVAATYVGAQLEQYGVEPAGDEGTYVQRATLIRQTVTAPPQLRFVAPGSTLAEPTVWTHGKEMLTLLLSDPKFHGDLKRWTQILWLGRKHREASGCSASWHGYAGKRGAGAGKDHKKIQYRGAGSFERGAVAVLEPATLATGRKMGSARQNHARVALRLEGGGHAGLGVDGNVFAVSESGSRQAECNSGRHPGRYGVCRQAPEKSYTWNAWGRFRERSALRRVRCC